MKRLSSKNTSYYKRVFPVSCFGFLGCFALLLFFVWLKEGGIEIVFMLVPLLMAAFVYFLMKNLVFDLIDEVYDEGDKLFFKNGSKEDRVDLTEIKNVNYSTAVSPHRVTLSIRKNTIFGTEVSFCPPTSLIPFKKNSDIDALIDRIDRARSYK